jgi:hypothetical protein
MPFLSSGHGLFFTAMNRMLLPVSIAALFSICAIAADTVSDIGLIEDGSTVVTAVDHTMLVNGSTQVMANQDGTVSVILSSGGSATTNTLAIVSQIPSDYVSASMATNIAKSIIRDKVAELSANLQSAEDTRAAVSNLITILKGL